MDPLVEKYLQRGDRRARRSLFLRHLLMFVALPTVALITVVALVFYVIPYAQSSAGTMSLVPFQCTPGLHCPAPHYVANANVHLPANRLVTLAWQSGLGVSIFFAANGGRCGSDGTSGTCTFTPTTSTVALYTSALNSTTVDWTANYAAPMVF